VARHTARSCSAEMPRRMAGTTGGNDSKGTGERCTLAHIDGKERCYACNEIKLLEKEFGTDRTARDGHARAARCATPQPEQ
jgi:hypothetical protein